jgi:hypothetical protein
VLDVSFGLYRSMFAPLLVVAVVCQLLPTLFEVYLRTTGSMLTNLVLTLLYYLVAIILNAVGVAATTYIVSDAYLARQTSAASALTRAAPLIGRLILLSITLSLLIGLGLILFIFPGLYLISGLVLSTVVMVLETPESTTAAMGRSWKLTHGFRGKVLGTVVVAFLLLLVPGIAISGVFGIMSAGLRQPAALTPLLLESILSVFVYPYIYTVVTVLYYDLRVRKEGFDLEILATAMQQG